MTGHSLSVVLPEAVSKAKLASIEHGGAMAILQVASVKVV
jgi:hypothetical protein